MDRYSIRIMLGVKSSVGEGASLSPSSVVIMSKSRLNKWTILSSALMSLIFQPAPPLISVVLTSSFYGDSGPPGRGRDPSREA